MANSINDDSPEIRDSLLSKNLILSDTVTDNSLSGIANGLGLPSSNTLLTHVPASENLEVTGEDVRSGLVSRNRYTSTEDMVSATIIDNNFNYDQQDGGYITENNELNFGGAGTSGLDTLDAITSQQGFGLDGGGLYPQGDIRTTVAGRVLGATGAINDTPLGIIGGEQLLLALGQRATFNAQRELFGQVNLSPFSLLSGSDFIVPDNSITVRSTTLGRIGDIALDVTGFNLPIQIIDDEASIENQDSIERNNALIRYTGKGQLMRLFDNLNQNKYKPNYVSDGSGRSKLGVNPEVTEYSPISSGTTLAERTQTELGIGLSEFDGSDKIWDPNVFLSESGTLLAKTKEMFNDRISYMVHFGEQGTPSVDFSQLNTPSGGKLSKGSGVLSEAFLKEGDKENVFCRTWTSTKTYSTVADLQKNTGLYNYKNKIRQDIEDSVLGDNGFVKISPYKVPQGEEDSYDAKKFMFSIENLAWNDDLINLPKFEIGNGDPQTGTKGRIMWFPPYDIKFTDTTSVDWDTTKFIGRGEPIYTYNSTERSGTLSFKVIIDYPDYMNDSKINTNELMSSLAAGCLDYNKYFSTNEERMLQEEINKDIVTPKTTIGTQVVKYDNFKFFFDNDISIIDSGYETIGLNADWQGPTFISDLKNLFTQNKGIKVKLSGYASKRGNTTTNKILSDDRITSVKAWFDTNIGSDLTFGATTSEGDTKADQAIDADINAVSVKKERFVLVDFVYNPSTDEQVTNTTDVKKETTNNEKEVLEKVKRRFHREDQYFEELKKSDVNSDKIIYDNIREKIKFFHPAFHSTTPEGFNSRLTFLHQCTRQGSTKLNNKSFNLAFGSPPVCILRIGDFYNTKIIINNLGINYEPLVWDLNPEGVGVQPMIANVEIAFKFIGGSALNGPINKLQNAVSFNYFANTGVYDPRADRLVRKDNIDPENPDDSIYEFSGGEKEFGAKVDSDTVQPNNKQASDLGVPNDANVVAENEAQKQEEVLYDDKSEVSNISVVGHDSYVADQDYLYVDFSYTHKSTSIYKLENSNRGNISLTSSSDPTLNIQLGYVLADPNDATSFIFGSSDGLEQIIISESTGTTDFTISFVDFNSDIVLLMNQVLAAGDGTLKLAWTSGSRSNVNF